MRTGDDGPIRPQQRHLLAIQIMVGDDVEGDALHRQPIGQVRIGREMPQPRAAVIDIGDVAGPHREERPAHARIADAAAIGMLVIGRAGIFGVIVGIPRIGAPIGLTVAERVVEIAALMIAVDLIGEGGSEKGDRRCGAPPRRQDIERHDVLQFAAAEPHAIDAARHALGDLDREIGLPFAIVEIVLMEMDRRIMARHVPPTRLVAGPVGAAHGAGGQMSQPAVEAVRTPVDDPIGRDPRAEIPPGQAFGLTRVDRRPAEEGAFEHGRILDPSVEKSRVRIVVWLRADGGTRTEYDLAKRAGGARHLGFAGIRDAPTALQRRLAQPQRAGRRDDAQLVPAPLQHRRCDLDPPALCFQDSAFGRNRQRQARLD